MCKKLWYQGDWFNLAVGSQPRGWVVQMNLEVPLFSTGSLPDTWKILNKRIPGVLKTECINEAGLKFEEEVKDTEIGHLFEHLILENVCDLKIADGFETATCRGRTYWDAARKQLWFNICLDVPRRERRYLMQAIARSIVVLEEIFETEMANIQTGSWFQLPAAYSSTSS